ATMLMLRFEPIASHGVAPTFLVMGVVYAVFMMFGIFTVRVPATGWRPEGMSASTPMTAVAATGLTADRAIRTPQFWLLWAVLCLNVTAGIGVLGQASPMIQEMFPGTITAAAAAGFV